jgi:hypothetical protein
MTNKLADRKDSTPAKAERTAEEIAAYKAKVAQVLSQGVVGHQLQMFDAEDDRRYAYIRETDADINRYKALGYRVETEMEEGMHGTGDGKRRIGDTILMSIPKDDYAIIEEFKREQNKKKMSSPIKEYKERAAAAAARGMAAPPIDLMQTQEE